MRLGLLATASAPLFVAESSTSLLLRADFDRDDDLLRGRPRLRLRDETLEPGDAFTADDRPRGVNALAEGAANDPCP
jgi:hypothetical protein